MFTPADIEFAGRKDAQAAFEREVLNQQGEPATTDDYLAAIADTRPTLTDQAITSFDEGHQAPPVCEPGLTMGMRLLPSGETENEGNHSTGGCPRLSETGRGVRHSQDPREGLRSWISWEGDSLVPGCTQCT